MTILDRYILNKFLTPFLCCLLGFIGIWFIFDLSDNLQDFIHGKATIEVLLEYYRSQIPQIIIICLPIALLLSLLYSLTAMSRANEVISMMGAGLSLGRIIMPLIGIGILLSAITAYFNYDSAPHAAAIRKQMLSDIKRGNKRDLKIKGHLFRNRADRRTWYVNSFNVEQGSLREIQIIQQNKKGDILQEWYARDGFYDPQSKQWTFKTTHYTEMNSEGQILKSEDNPILMISGWSETPWRISSSVMNPDFLSVLELNAYLNFNSDFPENRLAPYRTHLHFRWALPLVCLVVVFLAAPLGVIYSRRGVLSGVALAIGLFFSLVFTSSLFIALGKGSRISPFLAAWGPLIAFACIGLFLLWSRSENRELPKWRFPRG